MKFSTKWLIPIGLGLFVYVIWKAGVFSVIDAIKKINPLLLLFAIIFTIPVILIKSWKFKVILEAHGEKVSFLKAVKVWIIGLFGETVTPGRIGAVLRAFYFENKIRALSAAVIDRVLEVVVLFAMGAVGIFLTIFWFGGKTHSFLLLLVFFALLPVIIYVLSKRRWMRKLATPIYKIFIPQKYREKLKIGFEEFYNNLEFVLKERKRSIAFAMFVGFMGWLVAIFQGWLIVLSFGVNVPYYVLLAFAPITTLVEVIPITISGFGTREATATFLYSLLGISASVVVAFSLVGYLVGLVLVSAVGVILFARNPVKLEL